VTAEELDVVLKRADEAGHFDDVWTAFSDEVTAIGNDRDGLSFDVAAADAAAERRYWEATRERARSLLGCSEEEAWDVVAGLAVVGHYLGRWEGRL
jgi:hypothetical protein